MSTNEVKNLPDPLEETEAGYRDPIRQLPPVSEEMLAGGFRKKYLRATSRLLALTAAVNAPRGS